MNWILLSGHPPWMTGHRIVTLILMLARILLVHGWKLLSDAKTTI